MPTDCFISLLNGFLDFAATETACADPNVFWLTVDQCPDWLEVRLEDPLGLVIGVTDVMAGLTAFATEIACKCHGYTPSSSRIDTRSRGSKCITGPFALTSRFDGLGRRSMGASGMREGDYNDGNRSAGVLAGTLTPLGLLVPAAEDVGLDVCG